MPTFISQPQTVQATGGTIDVQVSATADDATETSDDSWFSNSLIYTQQSYIKLSLKHLP